MSSAPPPPSGHQPLPPIGPTGKSYIASLLADSSTWNQTQIDLDADLADLMFFYCYDFETGFRWLGQATHSSFSDLCIEVSAEPETWGEHMKDLDRVVSTSIHERVTLQLLDSFAPEDLVPTELLLMQSLACVAATMDWSESTPHHPGMHIIAIRYVDMPQSHFHVLRLSQREVKHSGPMTDHEFVTFAENVVAEDKDANPNWFK